MFKEIKDLVNKLNPKKEIATNTGILILEVYPNRHKDKKACQGFIETIRDPHLKKNVALTISKNEKEHRISDVKKFSRTQESTRDKRMNL
ncbi:hypothetical protein V1477_013293 [Vespula maculifrons]|uniref:Uncharacterized protein n=1 Tax=Vespula maculifrons TaxID=7453 RepID=A0ABD2BW10_VESMC